MIRLDILQILQEVIEEADIYIGQGRIDYGAGMLYVKSIICSCLKDDGWIPVKERLPELDEFVTITDKNGYVASDICYGYAENYASEPSFHRWDDDMCQCYTPDVIAWQPLPTPYQPKEEKQ